MFGNIICSSHSLKPCFHWLTCIIQWRRSLDVNRLKLDLYDLLVSCDYFFIFNLFFMFGNIFFSCYSRRLVVSGWIVSYCDADLRSKILRNLTGVIYLFHVINKRRFFFSGALWITRRVSLICHSGNLTLIVK